MKPLVCILLAAANAFCVSIEQYNSHDFAFRAPVSGNPFDVELTGEFSGPGGVNLLVPGFYDGSGVWKIRFSPTRRGRWTLRTLSPVKALDGRTESDIQCTHNGQPRIHGVLRVDPRHPHHFVYEDGTRYFLMGYECDWLWALPPEVQHRLVDQIAARGFNHVLVNVFAYDTTWSPGRQNQWDYGPPALFPWQGTNAQPDHSRLNPAFFQAYDRMLEYLREKGMVAHIMFKVFNKLVHWPPPGSRDEARYFRYVTARYQGYSNVVWDFSKEAYYEKDKALEKKLLDLIRSADAYHHLTTAHDNDAYDWNPALNANIDFRSDQQHTDWPRMIAFDRAFREWPAVNVEFGYERGVEDLPTYRVKQDWQEVLRRAWLVYTAGGYGAYYYSNTAWDLVKPDPEPPGLRRFQVLAETLSALPYWRMQPADHLAVGGPCLALAGEVYAFYAESPKIVVNLTGAPPSLRGEWIDTWTGAREPAAVSPPGVHTLERPKAFGDAPAVLIVRK
ncbi:MAG TPA: DUF5060 domain-containing protein [Bryobacteraceae bacterium]|nr:DUF5060 domain-containing protein [Bryobacteraceae bacterium]